MSSIKLYREEEVMKKEEDKQPAQIQESTGNAISDTHSCCGLCVCRGIALWLNLYYNLVTKEGLLCK